MITPDNFPLFCISHLLNLTCFTLANSFLSVFWFSGYFLTKIFHPNIATNGEICVNALKRDWNPSLGLRHVLMVSSLVGL